MKAEFQRWDLELWPSNKGKRNRYSKKENIHCDTQKGSIGQGSCLSAQSSRLPTLSIKVNEVIFLVMRNDSQSPHTILLDSIFSNRPDGSLTKVFFRHYFWLDDILQCSEIDFPSPSPTFALTKHDHDPGPSYLWWFLQFSACLSFSLGESFNLDYQQFSKGKKTAVCTMLTSSINI